MTVDSKVRVNKALAPLPDGRGALWTGILRTHNPLVPGSSPGGPTKQSPANGEVAKLCHFPADWLRLEWAKSSSQAVSGDFEAVRVLCDDTGIRQP